MYVSIPQWAQVPWTVLQEGSDASMEYHTNHMPGCKEPSKAMWYLLPNYTKWKGCLVIVIHSYIKIYQKINSPNVTQQSFEDSYHKFVHSICQLTFQSKRSSSFHNCILTLGRSLKYSLFLSQLHHIHKHTGKSQTYLFSNQACKRNILPVSSELKEANLGKRYVT
jgi:hypothetical protein